MNRWMRLVVCCLLTTGGVLPARADEQRPGETLKFRRLEATKAAAFAQTHPSWGVARDLDEAIEVCMQTGFIEERTVVRAGDGPVVRAEPDGTQVIVEISGTGGSAVPVGGSVHGAPREAVRKLMRGLGVQFPRQTLVLIPPQERRLRVTEIRLVPGRGRDPAALVVELRPDAGPADETSAAPATAADVLVVPRAIPRDAVVTFTDGERDLCVIGGDVGAGPRPAAAAAKAGGPG